MGVLILPLAFVAMWLLMIRPQQQRLRAQRALVQALEPGLEVITAGGLIGTITEVTDREVRLDLGRGNEVRILRTAVSGRMPTETPAPLEED
jgi:preprotein translocase subunit YajC